MDGSQLLQRRHSLFDGFRASSPQAPPADARQTETPTLSLDLKIAATSEHMLALPPSPALSPLSPPASSPQQVQRNWTLSDQRGSDLGYATRCDGEGGFTSDVLQTQVEKDKERPPADADGTVFTKDHLEVVAEIGQWNEGDVCVSTRMAVDPVSASSADLRDKTR